MLSIFKGWFRQAANPIGVDFGSDCLRMAQVAPVGNEWRLIAAASADVPSHVRHDPGARVQFFIDTARELLAAGRFSGRSALIALPASSMFIQHLRLAKMDDEETRKAIPWEARGKIPIDPSHALLRHHVAGEVYHDQEQKNEVIVMAAARELINHLLAMAARARLDVAGICVEPKVIVDCFTHIYRRRTDAEVTSCFVDLGCSGTRVVIARGGHMLFARSIPVGGDHFTRAVASALGISYQDAKLLRLRLAEARPAPTAVREKQEVPVEAHVAEGFAILNAAVAAAQRQTAESGRPAAPARAAHAPQTPAPDPADINALGERVEAACRDVLNKLVEELDMCRRYHEATFPNRPVDRLIFVGGEARQRWLCQRIAEELNLTAQVGDPLVRMGRLSDVGIESGIDRRQPQPQWTVAIGLSLGEPRAAAAHGGAESVREDNP